MIGYHTRLRISECFRLTWDDINLEPKQLSVNKQVVKQNYGVDVRKVLEQKGKKEEKSAWYFGSTKTLTSTSTLDLDDKIVGILREAKIKAKENGQYFYTTDSFKYASRVINNNLKIDFNYHALRHTHLTIMIEEGASIKSIKSVQAIAGHTNIQTTMNTYVHNTDSQRKETNEVFTKHLNAM